jgi:hypothetical protein
MPEHMLVGTLFVGEKPSGQVNNVGASGTFRVASLGLVTECVGEGHIAGTDVLDGDEFSPGGDR